MIFGGLRFAIHPTIVRYDMRIITKRALRQFWESDPKYAYAKGQLEAWYAQASKAEWKNPSDIKAQIRHASILKNNRVILREINIVW
jgi:mRNA interferase HigB